MKFSLSLLTIATLFLFNCQSTVDKKSESAVAAETEKPVKEEETGITSPINPNLSSKEELMKVAGITADLADKIIAERPFLSMTAFDKAVGSIIEADKSVAYAQVFVPLNLNTAPEDEIKLIPGIGNKMAHEFEEYRPYVKIDQFRREMGKYVDENEVARLEQYVFVPVNLNSGSKEEILAIPGVGERMHHEFEEYRPYQNMEQFRREIGKYVDENELNRLERYVTLD